MSRSKGSKNKTLHKWSEEEKEYLASIVKGNSYKEIAQKMKEKFCYDFADQQIKSAMARYKLTTGTLGHFKKGSVAWNKGLEGYMKANKTSFKKGNIPHNYRPIGSERVNKEGYTEIKVADPNKWELKHRHIYKKHYGEIPKGRSVIFADTNKTNFNIDNLILVSKSELMILNNNKLIYKNSELTKTGVNIAKVIDKVKKMSK